MYKYILCSLVAFSAFSAAHADILQVNLDEQVQASGVEHWNDSNFENAISDGIVVVDFYADWCPPCRKFGPVFEEVAEELEGAALFGKVNVDNGRQAAGNHNVSSIPTIIIFKDGKEIKRRTGGADAATFRAWVESVL